MFKDFFGKKKRKGLVSLKLTLEWKDLDSNENTESIKEVKNFICEVEELENYGDKSKFRVLNVNDDNDIPRLYTIHHYLGHDKIKWIKNEIS